MMNTEPTLKPSGFSFGFSKKLPAKKLVDSSIRDDSTKVQEDTKDYVLQVDSVKGIDSTKPKETVKELIIPCEGNKYKFDDSFNAKSDKKKTGKTRPENELDIAAQELIQESKDWEQRQEENNEDDNRNANLTIRMDKDEEEAIFKEDVESRALQSTLDDYDSMPVQ